MHVYTYYLSFERVKLVKDETTSYPEPSRVQPSEPGQMGFYGRFPFSWSPVDPLKLLPATRCTIAWNRYT